MATGATMFAASSGAGRGDTASWQHREHLQMTRKVVQLVQAGNSTADSQAG